MLTTAECIGGIPVVIRLEERDMMTASASSFSSSPLAVGATSSSSSGSDRPSPAAFVLPRTTCLLAVLPDVLALFAPLCPALATNATQVWFAVNTITATNSSSTIVNHSHNSSNVLAAVSSSSGAAVAAAGGGGEFSVAAAATAVPVDWTYPIGAIKDYAAELKRWQRRQHKIRRNNGYSNSSSGSSRDANVFDVARGADDEEEDDGSEELEPLEVFLRIRQPATPKLLERRAPLFVNFARLPEFIRNEVRQCHKAAYAAMYGSYRIYESVPEGALRAADGFALYRPFVSGGGGGVYVNASSSSGSLSMPPSSSSSPHTLPDYQQLLRESLGRRPAAYIVRLGFPFAHADSGSGTGSGSSGPGGPPFSFASHRVPAGAPLRSLAAAVEATTATATRPTTAEADDGGDSTVDDRDEAVTLGLLLWRLFHGPCLGWLAANGTTTTTTVACDDSGGGAYGQLLRALASRYYTNAPPATTAGASAVAGACGSGAEAARWEAAMAARLTRDYDGSTSSVGGGGGGGGLPLSDGYDGDGSGGSGGPRLLFEVQGTRPLMETPVRFLEALMASSERAIYVTVRVARG